MLEQHLEFGWDFSSENQPQDNPIIVDMSSFVQSDDDEKCSKFADELQSYYELARENDEKLISSTAFDPDCDFGLDYDQCNEMKTANDFIEASVYAALTSLRQSHIDQPLTEAQWQELAILETTAKYIKSAGAICYVNAANYKAEYDKTARKFGNKPKLIDKRRRIWGEGMLPRVGVSQSTLDHGMSRLYDKGILINILALPENRHQLYDELGYKRPRQLVINIDALAEQLPAVHKLAMQIATVRAHKFNLANNLIETDETAADHQKTPVDNYVDNLVKPVKSVKKEPILYPPKQIAPQAYFVGEESSNDAGSSTVKERRSVPTETELRRILKRSNKNNTGFSDFSGNTTHDFEIGARYLEIQERIQGKTATPKDLSDYMIMRQAKGIITPKGLLMFLRFQAYQIALSPLSTAHDSALADVFLSAFPVASGNQPQWLWSADAE